MRSPSGGNSYMDSNTIAARNNAVNVLNMSTDNLIRPEYQKFYDLNQRSNFDLNDSQSKTLNKVLRNHNQSTSLGPHKRSNDGLNSETKTTNYSSLM